MKATVLVVDDEPTQRELLQHVLQEKLGYRAVTVPGGMAAVDYVLSGQQPVPDVVLLDLSMPDVDGMQVIRTLRPLCPELPIVVLTAYGSLENAVAAVRAGASDFLAKPVSKERLGVSIQNARRTQGLFDEVRRLQRQIQPRIDFSDLAGPSAAFDRCVTLARRMATSVELPVMLVGENGTGKRMLAQAIHGASPYGDKPYVAASCGMLEGTQGWERLFGTFTMGGVPEMLTRGLLAQAHETTLLLEHPEYMTIPMQHALLHALQHARVQMHHGHHVHALNTRVIATLSGSLEDLIGQGKLHAAWRQVLGKVSILVPTLRARPADILPIAQALVEKYCMLEHKFLHGLADDAEYWMQCQAWPGNIRQLSHMLHRAVVMCTNERITLSDLQGYVGPHSLQPTPVRPMMHEFSTTPAEKAADAAALSLVQQGGVLRPLAEVEAEVIRHALSQCHGRITKAARELGIGRSTLYRKLQEMGEVA